MFDFSAYSDDVIYAQIAKKELISPKSEILEALLKELDRRTAPEIKMEKEISTEVFNSGSRKDTQKMTSNLEIDICNLRLNKNTHAEIVEKTGVSARQILRILSDNDLVNFATWGCQDVDTESRILRLYDDGKTVSQISAMLNIDNDVIRRWVNKNRAECAISMA